MKKSEKCVLIPIEKYNRFQIPDTELDKIIWNIMKDSEPSDQDKIKSYTDTINQWNQKATEDNGDDDNDDKDKVDDSEKQHSNEVGSGLSNDEVNKSNVEEEDDKIIFPHHRIKRKRKRQKISKWTIY